MAKYVYIAAPYTIGDVALNIRTVVGAAELLATAGFIPFVPHLSYFWHFLYPHQTDFWYQYDLAWLEKCDCLVRLAGESVGADNEVRVAQKLGLPIYLTVEECIKSLQSLNSKV